MLKSILQSGQLQIDEVKQRSHEAAQALSRYPVQKPSVALRLVEIVLASLILLITAPIMLVVAIIIRLDSPGRAVFRQTRLGLGGQPFRFVKFRTMYQDARRSFPKLYDYRYSKDDLRTLTFKIVDDPRVTSRGKWLRKSTLDELPNFWNVLRGDMALVGPRPEIPEMLPYYKNEMLLKFTVRPGVTGLAQISGRGKLGFYETVDLDVEYVKNRSIWLDTRIFFITIWKMISREGAF